MVPCAPMPLKISLTPFGLASQPASRQHGRHLRTPPKSRHRQTGSLPHTEAVLSDPAWRSRQAMSYPGPLPWRSTAQINLIRAPAIKILGNDSRAAQRQITIPKDCSQPPRTVITPTIRLFSFNFPDGSPENIETVLLALFGMKLNTDHIVLAHDSRVPQFGINNCRVPRCFRSPGKSND